MKSRVDCFMQMPFRQFAVMFPDMAKDVPMLEMFLADPNYLVRIKDGKLEIGYTEDAWEIK